VIAVFSVGDASIIVAAMALIGTFVQGHRNRRDIKQISHSVNHIGPDEPTLIQRVVRLERRGQRHAKWEADAFGLIAEQLGVRLPDPPDHPEDETFIHDAV